MIRDWCLRMRVGFGDVFVMGGDEVVGGYEGGVAGSRICLGRR